eukprot:698875-Rhodomonas_salina.1
MRMYVLALRCAVPRWNVVLRGAWYWGGVRCYAMSGTQVRYGAMRGAVLRLGKVLCNVARTAYGAIRCTVLR